MNGFDPSQLSHDDQLAFDALLEAGFDPAAVPAAHRDRAQRLAQLLGLLDKLPAPSSGDLLAQRTIEAVADARQKERYTQQIQSLSGSADGRRGPGLRWPELIAVAAMVLISVSLIWPTLSRARANARQQACQANLAAAGMGFGRYAADNAGLMPAVQARAGDPWWNVNQFDETGHTQSNSAHLFVLIRGKYADPEELSCPGNPNALRQVTVTMRDWPTVRSSSFSYQNQFTDQPNRLNRRVTIAILSDKNPLFLTGKHRSDIDPSSISSNHAGLGVQNVLLTSGEVRALDMPLVNHNDNIWLTRDKTSSLATGQPIQYTGREVPTDEDDSFLVP